SRHARSDARAPHQVRLARARRGEAAIKVVGGAVENRVSEVDVTAQPAGNPRVLWIASVAFALGFAVWGMFSALSPFLIKWYAFSATQVLVLASMEPLFAAAVSIPLGIWTDKFGGRTVFTLLLLSLAIILFCGMFA